MEKSSPPTSRRYWFATKANPTPSSSRNERMCSRSPSSSSSSRSRASSPSVRKSKLYGSFSSCRARSDWGSGSVASKFVTALPCRRNRPLSIWRVSTARLQPCSTAARAYQSRSAGSLTRSMRTTLWPHGISAAARGRPSSADCPTSCGTTCSAAR